MAPGKSHKVSKGSGGRSSRTKKPLWKRLFKWTLITGSILFVLGIVAAFIVYRAVDIPNANAEFQTQTTKVYYSDGKHQIGTFETQNRTAVDLDKVAKPMQGAVIAAEDRTFYSNRGIDFKGIIRAARNNATTNTTQGASTITQQYVKVLYLNQERTLSRKIKEAVLSLKVHNQLSKDDVLEGYLNTIYFGHGAYGVETAAQTYFGHSAENLTVRESAVLAAVINNPSRFDPYDKDSREALKGRYAYVLDGMANGDVITDEKAAKAAKKLPKLQKQKQTNRYGGPKGFLLRMTEQQLQKEGFTDSQINGGGLNVVTTFGYRKQKDAVQAVKDQRPDGLKGLHVALSSVDTDTGALRAVYAGKNYVKNQYNWALAGAQPGSAFKPFALAAALNNGFSLETSLDGNSPFELPDGGSIQNEQNRSYGTVPLLTATEESINTAFVDLTLQMDDGPEKIREASREAGLPLDVVQRIDPVTAITLGYAVVPNVDMANAYATFANNGKRHDWYAIEQVKDPNGDKLFSHKTKTERAFSKDVSADVSYALQKVVDAGTGVNADTVCPTAGKTGTATARKNPDAESYVSSSWFVGYTPKLSTSVMYVRGKNGNGKLEGYLEPFFGSGYPSQTFQEYMNEAVNSSKCGDFPEPANLEASEGNTYAPPTTQSPEPTETETTTKPPETTATSKSPSPSPTPTTPKPTTPTPTGPTTPAPTSSSTTSEPPIIGNGGNGGGSGGGG